MAGLPSGNQLPPFVVGVLVLIAVVIGIGLLGWHLLIRPLPAGLEAVEQPLLTDRARQIIALFLTLGGMSIGIAAVWDEVWHSKYGIPFGDDFFWRPHLMLYFGLTTLIIVGGWCWWTMMSRGKGTLQQRFRANPLMGITFLGGLYTIYAVGADPIWHRFYGTDLAPWSLPHLLILVLIMLMGLLTITYHKSLMPQREWRIGLNFTGRDLLITLVIASAMLDYVILLTVQWYSARTALDLMAQVVAYPNWLLPVFITFLATLFGVMVLHATRQIGSATLVGLIALVVRFALDSVLGSVREGTHPLLLILPLLIGLDVLYAISIRRTQKPPTFWMSAGITTVFWAVIGLPLMNALFPYPPVIAATIPVLIIAGGVTAVGGTWLGNILGDLNRSGEPARASAVKTEDGMTSIRWANILLYVAYAAFLVYFITTAIPPVPLS